MTRPLIACLLLTLSFAAQDLQAGDRTAKQKKRTPPPHLVETVVVKSEWLHHSTVVTGSLRARRSVRIFTQEEGRITEMPFYEGDTVKKGEVVATLDDSLLRARLNKAEATRRQAALDLKRIRSLAKKKLVPEEEMARAATNLQVAEAEEAVLRTRLGYSIIRAPFDGVVSQRLVEPGDAVAKHTHLMTISDPASLVTELAVSELLLPHLARGDRVEVGIDALGGKTPPGKILRIHPEVDPATRRGTVEVALDPVPEGARAGQFCRVTLRTRELLRRTIPFAALRRDRQGEFVYRINGEKAERTPVRSGLRLSDRVEILEGLEDGDRVVTRGFLGLRDGKKVELVTAAEY